ncbi:putative pentatricopeptide repeat-containing protein At3g49142 [Magnolia sinica]|uniref:putative pentatricopeptide repeat-containing protein At3g49142 n=1 Tax=Magnolia sinica TaxID=86752 RepID=UPI00265A03BB|nr:putative pentatricopeptide repeat-containing protein At3g49142 [Magnolia sinica]
MQESNTIQPDTFTIVAILGSSSCLASLRQGKEIHGYVYRATMEHEIFVTNRLIDMYGKCGDVEKAQQVFDNMQERDVGSWTALINCYGLHGHGTRAIAVFEKMKQTPSGTPQLYFSIDPTMKHHVCIVDMLGRAGHLMEALKFISDMPIQPDSRVWEALLGAASIRGDRTATEIAVKQLLELEPENSVELQVQLSSIYAKAGKWDDVAKIRGRMKSKSPGISRSISPCRKAFFASICHSFQDLLVASASSTRTIVIFATGDASSNVVGSFTVSSFAKAASMYLELVFLYLIDLLSGGLSTVTSF